MAEMNINIEGCNVNGVCVGCLNYNRKMFYGDEVKNCYKILGNINVPDGLAVQVCWQCLAQIQNVMRFKEQINNSFKILIAYSKTGGNFWSFLNSYNDLSRYAAQQLGVNTFEILSESAPKEKILDEENVVQHETDITNATDEQCAINEHPQNLAEQALLDMEVKELEDFIIIVSSETEDIQYTNEDYSHEPIQDEGSEDEGSEDESSEVNGLLSLLNAEDIEMMNKARDALEKRKLKRKAKRLQMKQKKEKSRKLKNFPEDLVDLYTMDKEEMWSVRQSDASNEEFQKFKYKCDYCLIGFNTKRLMDAHLDEKHTPNSENDYECNICKAYFTEENIKTHKKQHLTAYRCLACNFLTSRKRIMLEHDCGGNNGDSGHPCPNCPEKIFSTKFKLAFHRSLAHREKPQCDCCGKVFPNKMTLKHHLKILPQDRNPKNKLLMSCKPCEKVFTSKRSYRNHITLHDGLSHPCPICGKLFIWKYNLVRHIRIHREKEQGATHQCRECGKYFSSSDSYNHHMKHTKKHAQKNPYTHVCRFCGKKFAIRACMNDHIDWEHLEIIKYQCSVCYKPFKTAAILISHMQCIHGWKKPVRKQEIEPEGEQLCHICGRSYETLKKLKNHVLCIHTKRAEPRIFTCPKCPATFNWKSSIYKHNKMNH